MGVRYDSEQVDRVLQVLADDGHRHGPLLKLREEVLAGNPAAADQLLRLAGDAGVTHLLERSAR